jgi:hypothetical protein
MFRQFKDFRSKEFLMSKVTVLSNPAATVPSQAAARLSLAATAIFVALLAALHVIKPELDPSWHFISEYAIGEYSWVMMLAFFCLALSCVSLFIAIKSQVPTLAGKIGLLLLLITAVGMTVAGIFPTDPITTGREAMTRTGQLHELGALLDLMPFAAPLISWSLARHNPVWRPARRALAWTAWLPLLGLVVFMGSTMLMLPADGQFGPEVLVGWPNRLLILTYCIWLAAIAWQANNLHR